MPKDYGCDVFLQGCCMEGTEDFDKLELPPGCALHRGYLTPAAQGALLDAVRRAPAASAARPRRDGLCPEEAAPDF
jgi:hypothetical protein